MQSQNIDSDSFVGLWDLSCFYICLTLCECLVFHPKHILYVGVGSTSCTIPFEIINPTTQIPTPIFLHIPCPPLPTPTVKLRESVWCNTNPDDLSVCSDYFIADRRMDVHAYQWPGMLLQLFPQPCNVIFKDTAIQTVFSHLLCSPQ